MVSPHNHSLCNSRKLAVLAFLTLITNNLALKHATADLFDSNPIPRVFCCLAAPLTTIMHIVSEVNHAIDLSCYVDDLCVPSLDTTEGPLRAYLARDLIHMTFDLVITMLAIWLIAYHGACRNRLYTPRREHRDLSAARSVAGVELQFTKNQRVLSKRKAVMEQKQHHLDDIADIIDGPMT
jgi:hypothetical protein